MLSARNIKKNYGKLAVLKGVDLEITRGEIVSIAGSSGAGKSTLLHILGTLDTPDSGEIVVEGQSLSGLSDRKLADFRNKNIGFVFQFHHLLPEFTALENVCIPAWIQKQSGKNVEKKAGELLQLLNLTGRESHKPGELSGGEQQRVAVARALINDPAIVMADEPTGNLDSKNAYELHRLFLDLRARLNQTFLIVTHNEELAGLSDRILHMKDGVMVNGVDAELR